MLLKINYNFDSWKSVMYISAPSSLNFAIKKASTPVAMKVPKVKESKNNLPDYESLNNILKTYLNSLFSFPGFVGNAFLICRIV